MHTWGRVSTSTHAHTTLVFLRKQGMENVAVLFLLKQTLSLYKWEILAEIVKENCLSV